MERDFPFRLLFFLRKITYPQIHARDMRDMPQTPYFWTIRSYLTYFK